jgi:hypothetical protein
VAQLRWTFLTLRCVVMSAAVAGVLACGQDKLLLAAATESAIYNAQRHLLPSRSPFRAVD